MVIIAHGASDSFRSPGSTPDAYVEYLRRRVAGGVGLIITQPLWFNVGVVYMQQSLDRHSLLVDHVKAKGAIVMMQLAHLGLFGRSDADLLHRPPLWGLGPNRSAAGETAHQMAEIEVEMMVEAYRQTARLAANAGFDDVEVHGSHGYLFSSRSRPRSTRGWIDEEMTGHCSPEWCSRRSGLRWVTIGLSAFAPSQTTFARPRTMASVSQRGHRWSADCSTPRRSMC